MLGRREIGEQQFQGCICECSWGSSINLQWSCKAKGSSIENLPRNICCSEVRNILVKFPLCAILLEKWGSFNVIYFSLIYTIHLQQTDRFVYKTAYFYALLNYRLLYEDSDQIITDEEEKENITQQKKNFTMPVSCNENYSKSKILWKMKSIFYYTVKPEQQQWRQLTAFTQSVLDLSDILQVKDSDPWVSYK